MTHDAIGEIKKGVFPMKGKDAFVFPISRSTPLCNGKISLQMHRF
jgi:hypothetical protein